MNEDAKTEDDGEGDYEHDPERRTQARGAAGRTSFRLTSQHPLEHDYS
jgi:hypothetical protein